MMMPPMRPDMSDQERKAANMSKQMTYFMPVMVFVFGMIFPAGIALYWVTQSMFMIVQQFYVVGWGGMKVPHWFPGAGRVTPLSFPTATATAAPAAALAGSNGQSAKTAGKGGARPADRPGAGGRAPGGGGQQRTGGGSRRNKRSR
jgi:hypothetical protein